MPANIKWSNEKVIKVLSNYMARRLVDEHKESPIGEIVLARLTGKKV
jgi:hypothetical protein